MPLYTNKNEGRYLLAVDPKTGKEIPGVSWADTGWALLKVYEMEEFDGVPVRVKCTPWKELPDGSHQREQLWSIVRRSFNLVDAATGKLVHRILPTPFGSVDMK